MAQGPWPALSLHAASADPSNAWLQLPLHLQQGCPGRAAVAVFVTRPRSVHK